MDRRSFLLGAAAAVAAPAIVRIDNIMPVRNRLIVPEAVTEWRWEGREYKVVYHVQYDYPSTKKGLVLHLERVQPERGQP